MTEAQSLAIVVLLWGLLLLMWVESRMNSGE